MEWVNFREIRARVSLEAVLTQYYQLTNLKRQGNTAVGPCPVHNGDNPRAFHADYEKNLWHCFTGCKEGGNQLDLVAKKDNVSVRDAALRLKHFFLDGDNPPPAATAPMPVPSGPTGPAPAPPVAAAAHASATGKKEKAVNPPLSLDLHLLPDHPHLVEDRKLQVATAQHFGVGYCARGILAGCIAFPICNETGQLVAYAGRRLKWSEAEELGKYRFPKGFHKERVLFNLHRALPAAGEQGALVLVEGFFSVLKLHEAGITAAVAAMGSELSEYQAHLLQRARHVVVLFDGDAAGRRGSRLAKDRLASHTGVHIIDLPDNWEPESCPPDLLRQFIEVVVAHDVGVLAFEPRTAAATTAPAAA